MNHVIADEKIRHDNMSRIFKGSWKTDVRVLCEDSANGAGFGLGGTNAMGITRKVFGGPLVSGPDAYLFGHASVIDNFGGTGAEIRQQEAQGNILRVRVGDTLTIDGVTYEIGFSGTPCRPDRHNLTLTPLVRWR